MIMKPLIVGLALVLAGPAVAAGADTAAYDVVIRETAHGIPHIQADDMASLGFGAGYAYAAKNICLLADALVTVRGERSQAFGPDAMVDLVGGPTRNLDSDVFFRAYLDDARIAAGYAAGDADAVALIDGYAAGYNHYLAERGPGGLPAACRDADWVRPASGGDLRRLLTERAIQASGGRFAMAIATAAPPAGDAATPPVPVPVSRLGGRDDAARLGSNAYALGGDLTADGGGLLLGNPHFPWQGNSRFFQMHLTLPGRLDVMGAALPPFPVPVIGFNRDVAWSHTVSASQRFVLHELALVPGDPLSYLVDGRPERMRPVTVTVPMAGADPVTRTVYDTRFGMVVAMPDRGLAWTGRIAYALADPERHDTRLVEQWLRLAMAASVGEIDRALADIRGTPWINTLAADRHGNALYADMTGVPAVPDDLAARCAPSDAGAAIARAARLVVLAGDRAACQVVDDDAGMQPDHGLMPADRMPRRLTRGLVFNSNDSHWLADPAAPLTGYARIVGPEAVAQRLRTRMGKRRLDEIVTATGGRVAPADLEAMLFDNRNLAAELVVDAMLSVCRSEMGGQRAEGEGDLASACAALAGWDRTSSPDSRGAALFREAWRRARAIDGLWAVAFDPARPFTTPAVVDLANPAVTTAMRQALSDAAAQLRAAGFPADIALGAVQQRRTGARTDAAGIPVPGGDEFEGVLNEMTFGPFGAGGYDAARIYGSSYIQLVRWDAGGPVARGLLTYGQSADPTSPFHDDQTRLFAAGQLMALPFRQAEIATDPGLRVIRLRASRADTGQP